MSWARHICGRLKSDFQYGIGIVYNTFPLPNGKKADLSNLESPAQAVINARAAYPSSTLAQLYDQDMMPLREDDFAACYGYEEEAAEEKDATLIQLDAPE